MKSSHKAPNFKDKISQMTKQNKPLELTPREVQLKQFALDSLRTRQLWNEKSESLSKKIHSKVTEQEYDNVAHSFLNDNALEAVIHVCSEGLRFYPSSKILHIRRGKVASRLKHYDEANQWLQKAIDLPSTDAVVNALAQYEMGFSRIVRDRYQDGLHHFKKAYELDPQPKYQEETVRACVNAGFYVQAEKEATDLIALDKDNGFSYCWKAIACAQQGKHHSGKYNQAFDVVQSFIARAIREKPVTPRHLLGALHFQRYLAAAGIHRAQYFANVDALLDKQLIGLAELPGLKKLKEMTHTELNDTSQSTYKRIAGIIANPVEFPDPRNDEKGARNFKVDALNFQRAPSANTRLTLRERRIYDTAASENSLANFKEKMALLHHPPSETELCNVMKAQQTQRSFAGLDIVSEYANELFPDNPEVNLVYGKRLFKKGLHKEAVGKFEAIPTDAEPRLDYEIGMTFALHDQYPEALPYFLRCVEKDPAYHNGYERAVRTALEANDFVQAAESASQWITYRPTNSQAYLYKAIAEIKQEKLYEAFDSLQHILNPEAMHHASMAQHIHAALKLEQWLALVDVEPQWHQRNLDYAVEHGLISPDEESRLVVLASDKIKPMEWLVDRTPAELRHRVGLVSEKKNGHQMSWGESVQAGEEHHRASERH